MSTEHLSRAMHLWGSVKDEEDEFPGVKLREVITLQGPLGDKHWIVGFVYRFLQAHEGYSDELVHFLT